MSDDNTTFDKDPNRKPKKKQGSGQPELKTQPVPKKGSKDYQVYFEPKSGEKPPKDQLQANKANAPVEGQGNNDRNVRQDRQKGHRNPRKESRDQTPGALRRKYPRVPKKFILELYHKTSVSRDIEHLLSISNQLFIKDKQLPANEESFDLDPNEGLLANPPKTNYSSSATTSNTNSTATSITTTSTTQPAPVTNNTTTTTSSTVPASTSSTSNTSSNPTGNATSGQKPIDMFDFSQQKLDPIQAMREKMKGKSAVKVDKPAEDINQKKPEDSGIKRSNIITPKEEVKVSEPPKVEEKPQVVKEQENGNGERYSDVDEEFERKVQNNQVEEPQENDFDDNFLDPKSKEESLAKMDDRSRPEWENVDSNQVIQQLQREEFHSGLPQDKRTIFGDRYIESRGETDSQRSKTDRSDGSRNLARDSGDFSKVSFENDRSNLSDEFNMQQGEYYGNAGMRTNQQQQYNMGYNPSEMNQNMYRGQQQQQQAQPQGMNAQYGNKGYMMGAQGQQGQQGNVRREGSATSLPQTAAPKSTTPPDFIFKYFSPDYDAKVWSYVDLEQKVQGPYSGRTMDEWYSKGYLPLELHVTIGKSNGYRSLKELAEVIINHTTQAQTQTQTQAQPQTTASRTPQQQYQQYQQQQSQPQYQQYQQYQQHQQQYQQQQHPQHTQQQQQQYYQQQQYQPQSHQQQGGYGGGQSYNVANKAKVAYNPNANVNEEMGYYGQQSPSVQQKQVYANYGKNVQEINPQEYYGGGGSQSNYSSGGGSTYSYGYEGQQNVNPNYGFKASPTTSVNTSGYYQEQGVYRAPTPTNQIGYSQPQVQKQPQPQYNKPGYQGSMQGYSGASQMSTSQGYGQNMSPGYGGQGNAREYGNSASGGGSYGGQGGSGGNVAYMMQQQMGNKGQMQNQGYPVEMSAHLKNMLGMMRPPSQQGDHPDLQ